MGLAAGNWQAVCAEVIREALLGPGKDLMVFTFKDGRVGSVHYSYAKCEGYSPFNEVLKQK